MESGTYIILHGGKTSTQCSSNNAAFHLLHTLTHNISQQQTINILLVYFAISNDFVNKQYEKDKHRLSRHMSNSEFFIASTDSFVSQASSADIIYIHGGSTKKLYHCLKEYSLKELIDGKIVFGTSAGANILCNHYLNDENEISRGLGVLPYNIVTHYNRLEDPKVNFLFPDSAPTLLIPESTAYLFYLS